MTHFRRIALVGLMGAGKSAVARVLGEQLTTAVDDLDSRIEAESGLAVADLFARRGEAAFRDLEAAALIAAVGGPAGVVACGGGIVLRPENRRVLRENFHAIWLEATPAEAARRIESARTARPLIGAGPIEIELERLLDERRAGYAEVAMTRIDTTGRSVEDVARLVIHTLENE